MGRTFEVRAKYIAEDQASATIQKLRLEHDKLSTEVDQARVAFDKGDISLEKYTEATKRATREQARIATALKTTETAVDKTSSRFSRFGASVKKNAVAIIASLAAVAVAFRQVRKSADELGQSTAFQARLAADGIEADKFIEKLKELSDNQVATNVLVAQSNAALALGIKANDIEALLKVATKASVDFGITIGEAFAITIEGAGRGSTEVLNNIGIVVKAGEAYRNFAQDIGVSVESLTGLQRQQALVGEVTKLAAGITTDFTETQNKLQQQLNRGDVAFQNLLSKLGTLGGGVLQGVAAAVLITTRSFSEFVETVLRGTRAVSILGELLPFIGTSFGRISDSLDGTIAKFDSFQERSKQLEADLKSGAIASARLAFGIEDLGNRARLAAPPLIDLGGAINDAGNEAGDAKDPFSDLLDLLDGTADTSPRTAKGIDLVTRSIINLAAANDVLTQSQQRRLNLSGGTGLTQSQQRRRRLSNRRTFTGDFTDFNIPGGQFDQVRNEVVDATGSVIP